MLTVSPYNINTLFNSSTSRPDFECFKSFNKKRFQAAAKWLKRFKINIKDYLRSAILLKKLLNNINILLRKKAEKQITKIKTI